jgi:hypothetical protein
MMAEVMASSLAEETAVMMVRAMAHMSAVSLVEKTAHMKERMLDC